MRIYFNKIKKECPKSYSLFVEFCISLGFSCIENDSIFIVYPFLLFGLLEKFFDEYNIDITPIYFNLYTKKIHEFVYVNGYAPKKENLTEIKNKAQIETVYKAFEIMEGMLGEQTD